MLGQFSSAGIKLTRGRERKAKQHRNKMGNRRFSTKRETFWEGMCLNSVVQERDLQVAFFNVKEPKG